MNANSSEEKSFLNRLTEITETNLSNEQFGVTELAREIGMSRSNIHRHLKALTNQSISHFICTIRLKKAKEMLRLLLLIELVTFFILLRKHYTPSWTSQNQIGKNRNFIAWNY